MDRPKLSENARRLLEGRLRQLEEERIPLLKRELAESADPLIQAALRATTREVTVVRHALATATSLEDEPHVPSIGPGLHLPPASKLRKPRLRDARAGPQGAHGRPRARSLGKGGKGHEHGADLRWRRAD